MLCEIFPNTCDFPNWVTMGFEALIGFGIGLFILKIDRKNRKRRDDLTDKINENTEKMNLAIQKINTIVKRSDDENNEKKHIFVEQTLHEIETVQKYVISIQEIHLNSSQGATAVEIKNRLNSISDSFSNLYPVITLQNPLCPKYLPDKLHLLQSDLDLLKKSDSKDFERYAKNMLKHISDFKKILNETQNPE